MELLSHSAQWYHYIPTCMLCLCVQCMYMWKYVACIWKVEVAWPMGSHFVEWWGSLLRRWVRRTSPHFVACHFTLRQTIRLTLSTPKLRHHHQLRCTQLYMYILLISSVVQLMFYFIFHLRGRKSTVYSGLPRPSFGRQGLHSGGHFSGVPLLPLSILQNLGKA